MHLNLNLFLTFLTFCLFTPTGRANGSFPRTRLDVRQSLFSGEKGKSFAETGAGYGAGVSVFLDGKHFVPFFALHASSMTGRQVFLDADIEVTSSFTYYSASTDLGLLIYPIERRKSGINVYFTGAGILGYNFVSLSKSVTLAAIPYSDQSFSGGYYVGIGSEWIMNSWSSNKWSLNSEILFRKENTTLFKKQYDLSCMIFSVGLGW